MSVLKNKRILLGVSGGIAAYKACELVRLLVKSGAEVRVMMTKVAEQFVGKTTFEALSGHPVETDQFNPSVPLAHIALRDGCDLMVIAPATANIIAKTACGIADDLVSTTILARACPLLIAPAMNVRMWNNVVTQRNVCQLQCDGVFFSGPDSGELACGENGCGRMSEPQHLLEDIEAVFTPKVLEGKRVLITGGPTFEAIDPVRGITNLSSGKQAAAIAKAARNAGAEVTLVSGAVSARIPHGVRLIGVTGAQDMKSAVLQEAAHQHPDIFISVAAVCDFRVENPSAKKIKKEDSTETLTLTLVKNPDILQETAKSGLCRVCVGFAAESEDLVENGMKKLQKKGADLIVANHSSAIGQDSNRAYFITKAGAEALEEMSKEELAQRIILEASNILSQKTHESTNQNSR